MVTLTVAKHSGDLERIMIDRSLVNKMESGVVKNGESLAFSSEMAIGLCMFYNSLTSPTTLTACELVTCVLLPLWSHVHVHVPTLQGIHVLFIYINPSYSLQLSLCITD